MKKHEAIQLSAYVGVSVLAVGAAFLISLKFIGHSRAQAPTDAAAQQQAPAGRGKPVVPAPQSPDAATAASNNQSSGIAELEGFLEPFIYDVVNRRDPFLPYAEFMPANEEGPSRALTPAQRFALEEMKLVG